MLDVMLDLETMGNGPRAAIAAIGAVEFDIPSREIGDLFYAVVDLESAVAAGGVIDASTVCWWMRQSDEARQLFAQGGEHIALALQQFSTWLADRGPVDEVRVWGNGAAFDNVVLGSAYTALSLPQPWRFWNNRCYRTVKSLHPEVKMVRVGTYHLAVDDAESQARHLIAMLGGGLGNG